MISPTLIANCEILKEDDAESLRGVAQVTKFDERAKFEARAIAPDEARRLQSRLRKWVVFTVFAPPAALPGCEMCARARVCVALCIPKHIIEYYLS